MSVLISFSFQCAGTQYAPLAQLVEHLTLNQGVLGSSPRWCTRKVAGWTSGEDGGLSRRKQEFDSPTGHQHIKDVEAYENML